MNITGTTTFEDVSVLLFDLDGTIADTNALILRTLAETLELASGRPWRREELLPHYGMRLRDQLLLCYPSLDLAQVVPFYRERYARYHREMLAEFPGMRQVLERLLAAGIRLGVVTSKKHASSRLTLDDLGYLPFFEIVVAEEDTARHKPFPDPLLFALRALGVDASTVAYVGDNPDDIRAAHAAGLRAIGVGWCIRPREELAACCPDALIDAPEELAGLLGITEVPT